MIGNNQDLTGTANLGTVLGITGIGTIAFGTAGTPLATTGGKQGTRRIGNTRSTWHSNTAKEKGNDLRHFPWLVEHHHNTQEVQHQ